ncbi:MAG: hypothetical protein KF862_12630 [Chitinophagaceae bacterium]|nr:hypothetical protein [Chitinophagaceae bacterium]
MITPFHIFFIILYLVLISVALKKINNKNGAPVNNKWLVAGFIAKVAAGFAYGYIYTHYFEESDSWALFAESLKEYHNLLHNPSAFFSTDMQFNTLGDIFSNTDNATWKNTDDNLFIKLLGVLNVLSGGNYYVTAVLFNFFPAVGLYYLYVTVQKHLSPGNTLLFIFIFFLPSCLFWNSGIHKDGLIVFFTGLFIYCIHRFIYAGKARLFLLLTAFICFFFIFLFRNVTALLLVPCIAGWLWATRLSQRHYIPYIIIYILCASFFFGTSFLSQKFNLPLQLAQKQHEFLALKGNSRLPLTPLEPTIGSYIKVFPQAVNHVLLRPYITEITGIFQLMSFIETGLVLLILLITAWKYRTGMLPVLLHPFSLFLITLSFSGLLLTGYVIPFTGAIVRYKCFYLLLLLLPFIAVINKQPENSSNIGIKK